MSRIQQPHNFKNLNIWMKGMELSGEILRLSQDFPPQNRFDLTSQIIRSAVSIPSNIAEGSSRKSMKEFLHFLDISRGSAFELETQLILAQEMKFAEKSILEILINKTTEIQKMLYGFKNNLINQVNK